MKKRKHMNKESKYNYKYGKPRSSDKKKTSRKFSFENINNPFSRLLKKKNLNFGFKLRSRKLSVPKFRMPDFNFIPKFKKTRDAVSGLHRNKFFLGSLALLILFAVILSTYNYFTNTHYIVYADGEPIGFVRDEAQLNLMMGVLSDYGPESSEELYLKALEVLTEELAESEVKIQEEPTKIAESSVSVLETDYPEDQGEGVDQEIGIEDVIDTDSSSKYNVVTQVTTELVYVEPEDLQELSLIMLKEAVYIETGAAVIVIDGEEIAALSDYSTAEGIVELIVNSYLTERGSSEILEHRIQEDINIVVKPVPPEKIISRDIALSLLSTGYTQRQVHVVQRGDSLWSIGNQNGMSVSEVKENNPQLTSNVLLIGQEIAIQPLVPYVHVETYEKLKTIEYLPYSTRYTEDSSMYTWQSKTLTEGVRGKNEVVYEIVRVNGVEKAREKISTEKLSDPVTRVIARGTKVPVATGTGSFIWPVNGGGTITSPFGYTRGRYHHGVDIACNVGTGIFAADDGIVTTSAYHRSYGYYIIVDHGNGFSTLYAHNSRLLKKVGTKVSKGDTIAYSGNTGNSTGPHLHFEIRLNGNHKNPMNYYKR